MSLSFFYNQEIAKDSGSLVLNEETSKHVVQVLRMQKGDELKLTDGKGNLLTAAITDDHKKKCTVEILSSIYSVPAAHNITIGISLIKNASRFEWFLEKAAEIGVSQVIPMICERTEKQHFRFERMKAILISAMLQSQQTWLTDLKEPVKFGTLINGEYDGEKFIAHCEEGKRKQSLTGEAANESSNKLILIGPEGDFTGPEITNALQNNFLPVTLGATRLRTETAGIVAATLMCIR